jgi:D-alanine-D-alanine ligase
MKIGLTYDLRDAYLAEGYDEEATAEFDRADTIDSLENAIRAMGHETERIGHVRQLVTSLAAGHRWDLVFQYLRGAARDCSRGTSSCAAGSIQHSMHIRRPGRNVGMPAQRTDEDTCRKMWSAHAAVFRCGINGRRGKNNLPFPLFAKPIAEGTGKGVSPASCISSAGELHEVCEMLLTKFRQPVLVETYLSGREFTVGILGTGDAARVLGTLEIVLLSDAEPGAYSYTNKERCEELVRYDLVRPDNDPEVADAERIALMSWRELNGRDAGRIDLRSDGQWSCPNFIEANPLAGLHPEHSDLPMLATRVGMSYNELIRQIVESAAERVEGF